MPLFARQLGSLLVDTWAGSRRCRDCGFGQQVIDERVGSDRARDSLESISTDVSKRGTGPTYPTMAPPCKQGQVRQIGDFSPCKDAGV